MLPSGYTSKVKEIIAYRTNLREAYAPQSVTLTLEDHIDISRGNMIVRPDHKPHIAKQFEARISIGQDCPRSI